MKKIFQSIYPSLIWTGIIFWLLTTNSSRSKSFSLIKSIPHVDKLIHWVLFTVFALLWSLFLGSRVKVEVKWGLGFLIFLAGSAYGMGLEFIQLYFTNRSFSWWDGLADAVGAAFGSWIAIKKPLWK